MNMNNFTFVYSIRIHEYSCIREPPGYPYSDSDGSSDDTIVGEGLTDYGGLIEDW